MMMMMVNQVIVVIPWDDISDGIEEVARRARVKGKERLNTEKIKDGNEMIYMFVNRLKRFLFLFRFYF